MPISMATFVMKPGSAPLESTALPPIMKAANSAAFIKYAAQLGNVNRFLLIFATCIKPSRSSAGP